MASRDRPSAPSAAPDRCASLANELASAEREAAAHPSACARDEDCACYGGPVCANALVTSCPGAVTRAAADLLAGLLGAWDAERCGGYLWSPSRCVPRCTSGRCVTHEW